MISQPRGETPRFNDLKIVGGGLGAAVTANVGATVGSVTGTVRDPDEIRDGYQLRFIGKDYAKLQAGLKTETVLVPDTAHNAAPENRDSQNVFIAGDNLDALKHLENAYTGKVDVIYIDPPYNTGSDGFVYGDNFKFTDEQLKEKLGLTDTEVARVRALTGKSSHSAWLTFMYPRLVIAKRLLKDTGVIFVSIDDNEQANLKLLMDEVFGGDRNFVGQIIWQTATDNNPTQIATEHEYVLCYVKNVLSQDYWEIPSDKGKIIQTKYEELKKQYSNDIEKIQKTLREWIKITDDDLSGVAHYSYVDKKGVFYPGNSANTKPGGYTYDIMHPLTKKVCAKPEYGYRWTQETFEKASNVSDVLWGDDEKIIPKIKKRLDTVTQKLKSYYYEDNRATTSQLKDLFDGKKVFNNPKSVRFIQHILRFTSNKDSLILDFFAGSATTADAVMQLNKEDGGNRKWILCTLDENCNPTGEAVKAGYKTIDEISRERIRRAAAKIGDTSGFKSFYLKTPTIQTLDKIDEFVSTEGQLIPDDMLTPFSAKELQLENTAKETDRNKASGTETLLATWLIDDGFGFDTKVEALEFGNTKKATAYHTGQRLYILDENWDTPATKALLNKLGKNELHLQMIMVYAYSLRFEVLTELKNNLKTNLDDDHKIEITERF